MSQRILILEDDPHLRPSLVEVLKEEGYEVHEAALAEQALELARSQPLDLVVADVRMRGMDGLECLAGLRELQPEVRCIVMTGYASEEAPSRAVRVQAVDYIYKPFGLPEFLVAVRRALEAAEERERYDRVLGKLAEAYRKLGLGGQVASDLAELARDRELAFSSLYVGIRSNKLEPLQALAVWDQLERMEVQRLADPDPAGRARLSAGYRGVVDMVTGTPAAGERLGGLEAAVFASLFNGVREGRISLEQLKLAPYLHALEPVTLEQSPELQQLRRQVWGLASTSSQAGA